MIYACRWRSLLVRASETIDGVTLLAAYHTAYNVVGVAVLLPLIDKCTRSIERILSERGSPFTRCLDPAALALPIATVEAMRRAVARTLAAVCRSLDAALATAIGGDPVRQGNAVVSMQDAIDALRQAQAFMSDMDGSPESEDEQRGLTSTLHALDYASRLAETAGEEATFEPVNSGPDDTPAVQLCAEAMRSAAVVASEVAAPSAARDHAAPSECGDIGVIPR
jgi:phosphate:Na+ symporter